MTATPAAPVIWHGWSRHGMEPLRYLHIGHLPGRKSVCLYADEGTSIETLAFFKSEEQAERAMRLLDSIIFGEKAER